ncbi:MAG: hypothetical protein ACRDMX_00525 [Solirubrobacteraceae bacterium]
MKRPLLALAAGIATAALAPAAASAQIVELGATRAAPVSVPSCPTGVAAADCRIVLTRTTAVQTVTNGAINPTIVKKPGWIVAFSVGLSNLSPVAKTELSYLKGLDRGYGGTPQLALTVLKPGRHNRYTVVEQSGTYHLIPFLGHVLQQPMALPPTFATFTALPVTKGELIGLTVPTWAPVLTYNLTPTSYAYRQSRSADCGAAVKPPTQTAQVTVGSAATYSCSYPGTRVQYSATEVVDQPYPKTYVGGPSSPPKKKHSRRR